MASDLEKQLCDTRRQFSQLLNEVNTSLGVSNDSPQAAAGVSDDSPQGSQRGFTKGKYLGTPRESYASTVSEPLVRATELGAPELVATPELLAFLTYLDGMKLNIATQTILLTNGVDSQEALGALHVSDLGDLGLTLGQRRLLERVLAGYSADGTTPVSQAPASVTVPLEQCEIGASKPESDASGELNMDVFLGFGIHRAQKAYHDIVDFLPKCSPYDPSPDAKTVIVQKEDGSLVVEPNVAREKALEKVSWQQWSEANLQIMSLLMSQGVNPRQYMTYTVIITQLAQKYEWFSVLKYDREYRKKQANSQCL